MEACLFCNERKKGHPETHEFVCGSCLQKLIRLNAEESKELFEKTPNERQKRAISIVKGIK